MHLRRLAPSRSNTSSTDIGTSTTRMGTNGSIRRAQQSSRMKTRGSASQPQHESRDGTSRFRPHRPEQFRKTCSRMSGVSRYWSLESGSFHDHTTSFLYCWSGLSGCFLAATASSESLVRTRLVRTPFCVFSLAHTDIQEKSTSYHACRTAEV